MPIGYVIVEYNDLLHCEQTNHYSVTYRIYEDDYVDAILDGIRERCGPTWEAYARIIWIEGAEVYEVGYLDK